MQRLRDVEAEFRAAIAAVNLLLDRTAIDSGELPPGVLRADLVSCKGNLEATYTIRAFAAFESAIRSVWVDFVQAHRQTKTHPQTKTVIDRCASKFKVHAGSLDSVHGVREWRNCLVHGTHANAWALPQACSAMRKFLKDMPERW